MKLIVKFTLITLLWSSLNAYSQKVEVKKAAVKDASMLDSTYVWTRGARLGFNLAPVIFSTLQKERKGFEFSIDTRLTPKLFPTFELGFENNSYVKDTVLNYTSNGIYGRIGVDYNLRSSDPASNDIFFVGARYGFYTMQQAVSNYLIHDSLWGPPIQGSMPQTNNYGHWIEIITGVKVELLHNIYLGWSLRSKFLLSTSKAFNYPQYMPGFGNGANTVNFGVTYSLFYQIPLMKVYTNMRIKKKVEEEPEETPANQMQDNQMQNNNNMMR